MDLYAQGGLSLLLGYLLGSFNPANLIGLATNYVCIATVAMSWVVPAVYGWRTDDWLGAAVCAVPAIPILWKHWTNFRRIRSGEELRFSYLWNKDEELKRIGRSDK